MAASAPQAPPPPTKTLTVPHLGGTTVGYALSVPPGDDDDATVDPSRPVVVMLNSMCMTSALFAPQLDDPRLARAATLVAVEPLGHGRTTAAAAGDARHQGGFTYWDSAVVALQLLAALGVERAYALGTSQGGWIVARMALLAPERIQGLILLGTSMDYESSASRAQGCWDPAPLLTPFLDKWSAAAPSSPGQDDEDFVVDEVWCDMVGSLGFGDHAIPETRAFWTRTLREVYRGAAGRAKLRMALVNLLSRDGLLLRLGDVRCPVHWLQGTKDIPYGTVAPAEQIKLFTAAPRTELTLVPGGGHYLSATNPAEVADAILAMIGSASNGEAEWDREEGFFLSGPGNNNEQAEI